MSVDDAARGSVVQTAKGTLAHMVCSHSSHRNPPISRPCSPSLPPSLLYFLSLSRARAYLNILTHLPGESWTTTRMNLASGTTTSSPLLVLTLSNLSSSPTASPGADADAGTEERASMAEVPAPTSPPSWPSSLMTSSSDAWTRRHTTLAYSARIFALRPPPKLLLLILLL